MTTTAGFPEQIDAYLAAVRASLADIAEDERADLLSEVEASLIESAGEIESPFAALGPPEAFAAELRASAGLGEPTAFTSPSPSALAAARLFVADIRRRPWVAKASPVVRELAPVWWVARGYLVVVAAVVVTGTWWSGSRPWIPDIATPRTGALVILAGVAASLAFGLVRRHRPASLALLAVAIDVVALVAIVPAVRHITRAPAATTSFVSQPVAPTSGFWSDGREVLNVYPYSRAGRLLHDVRLYDDLGRPLQASVGDVPPRRVPRTSTGLESLNAYPIRYFQPGTQIVAHPDAGPQIRVPRLVTPPLP